MPKRLSNVVRKTRLAWSNLSLMSVCWKSKPYYYILPNSLPVFNFSKYGLPTAKGNHLSLVVWESLSISIKTVPINLWKKSREMLWINDIYYFKLQRFGQKLRIKSYYRNLMFFGRLIVSMCIPCYSIIKFHLGSDYLDARTLLFKSPEKRLSFQLPVMTRPLAAVYVPAPLRISSLNWPV